MPLIVISGYPSSGKSSRAAELRDFFESKNKNVKVISEHEAMSKAGFNKNECTADSQKEKLIRSDMKSETVRHLNKDTVVILDAGNYIKGYRYELFCASKSARTTQCTLFCGIQKEKAWEFNEKNAASLDKSDEFNNLNIPYTRENFDALWLRFEEPQGNCRWDRPLFVTFPDTELPFDEIFDALFVLKPPPPNQSTQNPPLSSTNYLFELDKMTQQIINEVISARKIGAMGPVPIKAADIKVDIPCNVNAIQLNRIRRQFINYSKMHTSSNSLDKIPQLFVQFLNSNYSK